MVAARQFLLGACFVVCCTASAFDDDFVNNLFTDLTPLLALFGERVTTQFISQATCWADNIILAMVPLGIVTAIVGAIRVGGPHWLKAMIGRARESRAMAEAELMSSTSHEVCELWNGQEIVRIMGEGPIREFIILTPDESKETTTADTSLPPSSQDEKGTTQSGSSGQAQAEGGLKFWSERSLKVIDLDDEDNKYLATESRDAPKQSSPSSDLETGNRAPTPTPNPKDPDRSPVVIIRNRTKDAPNLTFNVNAGSSRAELYIAACLATFLQISVVAYFGYASYPARRFKDTKEEKPVSDYAFPTVATGTLLLVVGMMICSHVVESSTSESDYAATESRSAQIVWLQRSSIVNDQAFKSFAIFPKKTIPHVRMSRRAPRPTKSETVKNRGIFSRSLSALLAEEALAVTGALVTIAGFLFQFVGLRGMHWSAPLVHLAAILAMTGLRVWLRRHLADLPACEGLVPGYELDWLAMTFGGDPKEAPWFVNSQKAPTSKPSFDQTEESLASSSRDPASSTSDEQEVLHNTPMDWRVRTDGPAPNEDGLKPSVKHCTAGPTTISTAQRIIQTRRDLAVLAEWHSPSSTVAIALARAIELTMSSLVPPDIAAQHQALTWSLGVLSPANVQDEEVAFRVNWDNKLGKWKAYSDELEAAISLWTYSVHKLENRDSANPIQGGTSTSRTKSRRFGSDTWLRATGAPTKRSLRCLGLKTPVLEQSLKWWMPEGSSEILAVDHKQIDPCSEGPGTENVPQHDSQFHDVEHHRRVGYTYHSEPLPPDSPVLAANLLGPASNPPTLFPDYSSQKAPGLAPVFPIYPPDSPAYLENGRDSSVLYPPDKSIPYPEFPDSNFIPADGLDFEYTSENEHQLPEDTVTDFPVPRPDFQWYDSLATEPRQEDSPNPRMLVAGSHVSLATLYAQHMFTAFMWAVARTKWIERIPGEAEIRSSSVDSAGNNSSLDSFTMTSEKISKLAQNIRSTGLGSLEEAYLMIIPPFSAENKLPRVDALVKWARVRGEEHWRRTHWREAGDTYLWLLRVVGSLPREDVVSAKATALLVEFLRAVSQALALHRAQYLDGTELTGLECDLVNKMWESYKAGNRAIAGLSWVFNWQRRSWEEALCQPTGTWILPDAEMLARLEWTDAHEAATVNDADGVETLFRSIDPSSLDILEWTPLHYSVTHNCFWITDLLLKSQVNVDQADIRGWTPIHVACDLGRIAAVEKLLQSGANIHIRDIEGLTPLHCAAKSGCLRAVELLFESGADVNVVDNWGSSPLLWAAFRGHSEVVSYLWDIPKVNVKIRDHNGRTLLHLAALGKGPTVQGIIEKIPDGDKADIEAKDRQGNTALHLAALAGHEKGVKSLLDAGAATLAQNKDSKSPIQVAKLGGQRQVVEMLHMKGAGLEAGSTGSSTPLHAAAGNGQVAAIAALIAGGYDIDAKDGDGCTALHLAAMAGKTEVCQLLVENGADIKARNYHGVTPLQGAASGGDIDTVWVILDAGANENARDNYGRTALDVALEKGHTQVEQYLRQMEPGVESVHGGSDFFRPV
ncbi:ankyrin repeat [Zalerion maritima]|uniref:Ankyrin repeat n=1 Tax=Zalerion maritima TaxID=339359 RepID=A0AAD5RXU2_9PEZI|nr:ankyrin repeat [Zalerion maritima]